MTNFAGLLKHSRIGFAGVLVLMCSISWSSCVKTEIEMYSGMGKRPVYLPVSSLNDVKNLPPQPIHQSGTVFLRDTLFFMLEQKKGIHVYNVKDTLNIADLTFLQIPAVTDFTVTGNRLYADNWRDLVTIDISDLYHIRVVDRQTNVFTPLLFPPLYHGIFECVDESKGAVIDWEDIYLTKAACTTN
jgi:hypothetical protein